jgi:hypothetical protein
VQCALQLRESALLLKKHAARLTLCTFCKNTQENNHENAQLFMSKNSRDLSPPLFAQDIYSEDMSLRVHSDMIDSKHTVADSRFQTYSYIRTCVLRKLSHGCNQLVLDVLILSETADMKPLGRNSEKSLCQNWT